MDCSVACSSAAINANSLGHINQNIGYPGAETNITPMKWIDGPVKEKLLNNNAYE